MVRSIKFIEVAMGYTFDQIEDTFNKVINAYEMGGFKRQPLCYIGHHNHVDLVKDDVTARISLDSGSENNKKLSFPVNFFDLSVTRFNGNTIIDDTNLFRFYLVGDRYYTTDLLEVSRARELNTKRYIDYHTNNGYTSHLKLSKLSERVKSYLTNKINDAMDNLGRSHSFKLTDVYFRHKGLSRKLIVVIKHSDNLGTEAIHFNP